MFAEGVKSKPAAAGGDKLEAAKKRCRRQRKTFWNRGGSEVRVAA